MTARTMFAGALAILATAAARPLAAQTYDWQYQWYWGAKGGMLGYTTQDGAGNTATAFDPQFGGEWLITAKRTALYVGFSQTNAANQSFLTVSGTPLPVDFNGVRRIQIGVVVLPMNGFLQPYLGGGFEIETLTNAGYDPGTVPAPSQAQANALSNATSGGFAMVMAGVQLRFGRRAAIYGQYQGSPQGRDFLLPGSSNSFEVGIRYAFLPSREDDVGQNK